MAPNTLQISSAGQPPEWLLDSCVTDQSGCLQLRGLEQAGVQCEGHPAPCFPEVGPIQMLMSLSGLGNSLNGAGH